jgi:hypothetical protein
MKRFATLPFLLLLAFCAGSAGPATTSVPGHGALSIQVIPNPILARHVSGEIYDFPFDVVLRETGGRPVSITRVSADVNALGSIPVANESYDAARIRALGFATNVPANGELRFHFSQRHSVPDDRLFGNVTADVTVDGLDDGGTAAIARTRVTITR